MGTGEGGVGEKREGVKVEKGELGEGEGGGDWEGWK